MTKRAELAAADSAGGIMSAPEKLSDEQIDAVFYRFAGSNTAGHAYLQAYEPGFRNIARAIEVARDAQWQARLDAALKEEREACAKLCEEEFSSGAIVIADIIRARPA